MREQPLRRPRSLAPLRMPPAADERLQTFDAVGDDGFVHTRAFGASPQWLVEFLTGEHGRIVTDAPAPVSHNRKGEL